MKKIKNTSVVKTGKETLELVFTAKATKLDLNRFLKVLDKLVTADRPDYQSMPNPLEQDQLLLDLNIQIRGVRSPNKCPKTPNGVQGVQVDSSLTGRIYE